MSGTKCLGIEHGRSSKKGSRASARKNTFLIAMFSRKFLQVYQFLSMSKNYLPQGTLKILYNSLVETHFGYGNIIWGSCEDTFLTRLQKLPNRAARIITGSDYDTPAEP